MHLGVSPVAMTAVSRRVVRWAALKDLLPLFLGVKFASRHAKTKPVAIKAIPEPRPSLPTLSQLTIAPRSRPGHEEQPVVRFLAGSEVGGARQHLDFLKNP